MGWIVCVFAAHMQLGLMDHQKLATFQLGGNRIAMEYVKLVLENFLVCKQREAMCAAIYDGFQENRRRRYAPETSVPPKLCETPTGQALIKYEPKYVTVEHRNFS